MEKGDKCFKCLKRSGIYLCGGCVIFLGGRGSNECSSAMRYTHALRDPRSLGASAAETSASASFIFLSDDQVVVFVFVRTGSIYNRVLLDGFRSGG